MHKLALLSCLTLPVFLAAALPGFSGGLESEIEEGDTRPFVIEILGEPDGRLGNDKFETLYYDRGTVEFADGKVTSFDLVSEREAFERETARLRKQEERQRTAAAAKEERIKDGQAVLKSKLADKEFAATPPSEQVAYWKAFKQKYPEINVSKQLAPAQAKVNAQKKSAQQGELTKKQQAELDERLAEGMGTPPVKTSSRKFRRYRRGRSQTATDQRAQQITDEYMREIAAK